MLRRLGRVDQAQAQKTGSLAIVFDDGRCTMKCKILDTSETGARLHVANVMFMPEQFLLKIRYGGMHNCDVVWQKGPTVGVEFTD